MIADLIVIVLPRIEMQVLILGPGLRRGAHVHVVERLAVHVEEIGIPLVSINPCNVVHVAEARLLGEDLQGLDLGEVVEVAAGDDVCVGVRLEDLGDEALKMGY